MIVYRSKKKECFANINIFSDNLFPYTKAPVLELDTPKLEKELDIPKEIELDIPKLEKEFDTTPPILEIKRDTTPPILEIELGTPKLGVYMNDYIFDTINNNNDYNNFVSTYTGSPENKCFKYAQYYNNNSDNSPKIRKQHIVSSQNDTCRFNSSSSSNWVDTPNSSPTNQYLNTYCVNGDTPNDDPPYCTL